MAEEKQLAENLLGRVRKLPATGGHVVDQNRVFAPFSYNQTVTRYFCRGCGSLVEIPQQSGERLAKVAGEVITSFENIYFECERCGCCADYFERVVIKRR